LIGQASANQAWHVLIVLQAPQRMTSDAVKALPAAARIADDARQRFDRTCPGAKDACDMIEHFAEYAEGTGDRQPGGKRRRADRSADRVAAAQDWPLLYDRSAACIVLGPIEIDVAVVCEQAKLLVQAIWPSVRAFEDSPLGPDLQPRQAE
jgi:hypothetical protein